MSEVYKSDNIQHDAAYYCKEQWKIQDELTRLLSNDFSRRMEQAEMAMECLMESLNEEIPALMQLDR